MKRIVTALALTAGLLWAPAALAEVVDDARVLGAGGAARLQSRLDAIPRHHFDVIFVKRGNAVAMAREVFQQRKLGQGDGAIAVSTEDRKVGVYLGSGFRSRGVDSAAISRRLKSDFYPSAKAGRYDQAAYTLANGLVSEAGRSAPAAATTTRRSNESRTSNEGGGFPWGILLFAGAVGGGLWFYSRRKSGGGGVGGRIAALEAQHARIISNALKLDEVETLGKFQEADKKKAYDRLATQAARLLGEARDAGDQLETAKAAVAAGQSAEVTATLATLERRFDGLESEVAGAVTTFDTLEGRITDSGEPDMGGRMRKLAGQLNETKAAYEQVRAQAPAGLDSDSVVENRLEEARRVLTTAPIDPKEATREVTRAMEALVAYEKKLDIRADREALRESRQNTGSYGNSGGSDWVNTAQVAGLFMAASSLQGHNSSHYGHDHSSSYSNDDSSSGGGWFGGGDSATEDNRSWDSGDSGSSGGGSWDSGDSGGDSGGGDSGGGGEW